MAEVRGILVRDPGEELVIRPTEGDVSQFGRAGDPVAVSQPRRPHAPSKWIRQDDYEGPENVASTRYVHSVRETQVDHIQARAVWRAADMLGPGSLVYDQHGSPVGFMDTFTYRHSPHTLAAIGHEGMRYDFTVVGPWRWRP